MGYMPTNDLNESFVVAGDGVVLDGTNGRGKEFCQPPGYEVELEQIWKSLDKAFMALFYCEEINNCNNDDSMAQRPCPIT